VGWLHVRLAVQSGMRASAANSGRRTRHEIVDHYPDTCGGCGRSSLLSSAPGWAFGRHQIAELPPISVTSPSIAPTSCVAGTAAREPAPGYRRDRHLRVRAEAAGAIVTLTLVTGSRAAGSQSLPRICLVCAVDWQRGRDLSTRLRRIGRSALPFAGWVLDQAAVHVMRPVGDPRRGPRVVDRDDS